MIITKRNNNQNDTYYLHKDHLGSTVAVSDASGMAIQQYMFDSFGKQYTLFSDSGAFLSTPLAVDRGYTGHKMVNELDIIHMNGRTYDPTLGRFLQADPHVQAPTNMQNYNRYSYVLNNPMSMTDPSGYFFDKLFKGINKALGDFAPIVAIGIGFATAGWGAAAWYKAATVGFITGGIATGSLKGAALGALTAGVMQQIGAHFNKMGDLNGIGVRAGVASKDAFSNFGGNLLTSGQVAGQIASHAMAGGIISVIGGGKFGHGFVSAGFSKGIGTPVMQATGGDMIAGTLASMAVGGTASVLSGGKFANGASTAAYQALFNFGSKLATTLDVIGKRGWATTTQLKGAIDSGFNKIEEMSWDELKQIDPEIRNKVAGKIELARLLIGEEYKQAIYRPGIQQVLTSYTAQAVMDVYVGPGVSKFNFLKVPEVTPIEHFFIGEALSAAGYSTTMTKYDVEDFINGKR